MQIAWCVTISRKKVETHSVEICKFFLHDILQKFRQINFLTFSLKNYTVNQFDGKFLQWEKISEISTL